MKKIYCILLMITIIEVKAQVKIGGNPTTIGTGQLLELETNGVHSGFKIASVALLNTLDTTTVPGLNSATAGTMIWNTASAGLVPNAVTPGFYMWMGTSWQKIATVKTINDDNIYNADGIIINNRVVSMDGNTLSFEGGQIGIGTNTPTTTLEVASNTPNVSGLKLSNISSSTTPVTGSPLGIDASGNIIVLSDGRFNGSGKITFGDIFPNTGSTLTQATGVITSATPITTTLGVVKATQINFSSPMPNTNYKISISGGTSNTSSSENEFSKIGGVIYYYSNKKTDSFILIAQELYPEIQQSVAEFSVGY